MLIGLLFLLLRAVAFEYSGRLAGALLFSWNGLQLWRATFSRRLWVLAVYEERFYIRLFKPMGPGADRDTEADVMALDVAELAGIQVRIADIFIHGPKPTVYQWLVIEPRPELRSSMADEFERLEPPAPGVCPIAVPNAVWRNESVAVRWLDYRPKLKEYARQIESRYPNLTMLPEARPELDLVSIVSKREPERRRLLAQAKRMGFNTECVWALHMYTGYTLYQRMKSLKEATEYMSSIDVGFDEQSEQSGSFTTTSADPRR
jgi:hypothetical protein